MEHSLPLQQLSREDKEELLKKAAEKSRRDYLTFCHYVDRGYQSPPHLQRLCQELQDLEAGKTENLMIFMPPRHGKSETVSRKFPAWWLGRHPNHNVIMASYAQSLTRGFSRHVRDLIESRLYQSIFPVRTSRDSRNVNDWVLDGHRGGLLAAGVGGATTGYGAHLFIIDDPVKNLEEAESPVFRERAWEWYRSVVLTRMEPGGKKILIMTRWNQDDLAGRILKELKDEGTLDEWRIVDMPAIIENAEQAKKDTMGRKVGDALWPERYTAEKMKLTKKRVGSRIWSALFQQEPRDPESRKFLREWFRYYEDKDLPPRDELEAAAGIDTATSQKSSGDNTAMSEVLRDKVSTFRIYVDRVFCDKTTVSTFAKYVSNRHRIRNFQAIHIESNNAGEAIKQRVEEVGGEEKTYPPIVAVPTTTDKMVRAMKWQHLVENGTLRFRKGDPKIADLIEHLINFDGTGSDVDDDIDSLGFALEGVLQESSLAILGGDDYNPY